MAGSHNVRISANGSHWFDVSARPSHWLSRIPLLGPFFAFNLGRNPKFIVSIEYLGYSETGSKDDFDLNVLPVAREGQPWCFDLGLQIGGNYIQGGDEFNIVLSKTPMEGKIQEHRTRQWPLTRAGIGGLEVQVGPPYLDEPTIYSFEVIDRSATVSAWIFTALGGILGVVIGVLASWVITLN